MNRERKTTIRLDFPLMLPDGQADEIVMRRPTMGDIIDNPITSDRDVAGEAKLYSVLCGMNIEDFRKIDPLDYDKLQDAYARFRRSPDLGAVPEGGGGPVASDGMGAR